MATIHTLEDCFLFAAGMDPGLCTALTEFFQDDSSTPVQKGRRQSFSLGGVSLVAAARRPTLRQVKRKGLSKCQAHQRCSCRMIQEQQERMPREHFEGLKFEHAAERLANAL